VKKIWNLPLLQSCNASSLNWVTTLPFWHGKNASPLTSATITLTCSFITASLKCLVAIELKIGEFEAAHKGQMELYLRWLEKHEQIEGENTPIGLILCAGKNQEHVELLQLDKSNIRVADYLTLLPPKELLEAKLHSSIEIARQRLAQGDAAEDGAVL
jgi:hypothetical protein